MKFKQLEYWVIPPDCNEEFVSDMEWILETYRMQYNPLVPVICMDEQPVQFFGQVRPPIPETKTHGPREDYEYERKGTGNIFMFTEPLGCRRYVYTCETKTKEDWARYLSQLITDHYSNAEKIILVCDNLNTHTYGAFYKAFPTEKAFEFRRKIEIRHTPKHGSWLNIAECELSVITRQCVHKRRMENIEMLQSEADAWCDLRNQKQKGVDWQFSVDKARIKLKRLYPKLITSN